jgi:hypothetical protein
MQIGQCFAVIEPSALGHEGIDELQHAVGAIDEAAQELIGIDTAVSFALVEPVLGAGGVFRRWQVGEGEEVTRLEMRARLLKVRFALRFDQSGRRIGKEPERSRPRRDA